MPAYVVGLTALSLACLALVGRPVLVLRLLVATTLLVPATLGVPGSPTPALTVTRLVLLAAALGLLLRVRRGELPGAAFAVTPVHLAWAAYLAVVLVAGLWFAPFDVSPQAALLRMFNVVDPLLFFVVALALVRTTGLRPVVDALTVTVLVASLVMVVEHITQQSYGQLLFADLPAQQGTDAARMLEQRGGGVRVRGASEFALQAGWVLAALLPLALVTACLGGRLRRAALPIVGLVLLVEAWTVSRSAVVGIGAAGLLVATLSRARAAQQLAVGVLVAVVLALVVAPTLADNYSLEIDQGSVDVREERLPFILGLAADQPWTGLGLGGLRAAGVPTTDATYLLVYAETGVFGLAALLVLVGVTVLAAARVLRCPPGAARAIGVAALSGVLVLLAGGLAFDSLQVLQSARLLQLLLAVAVVSAELKLGRGPLPRRPTPLALMPAAVAVFVGLLVALLAPSHSAQTSRILTVPAFREAGLYDPVTAARPVLGNACTLVEEWAESLPGEVRCRDLRVAAGVGQLRVQADDAGTVAAVTDRLLAELRGQGLVFASFEPETAVERGRPTLLRTAPAWAGMLALGTLLLPPLARRPDDRRADTQPVPSSSA